MTIYIRPDGTISGSNEPLPVKPKEEWTDSIHNYGGYVYGYGIAMKNYENALTAWKESCIDFEDQEKAKHKIMTDGMTVIIDKNFANGGTVELIAYGSIYSLVKDTDGGEPWKTMTSRLSLIPDTIFTNVDAETEAVNLYHLRLGLYRTVLRIKDKP